MRIGLLALSILAGLPVILAQTSRDDWQHLRNRVDFEQYLDHSLEDAPLSAEERAQIYALVDDSVLHSSYRDDQRAEERRVVLSARVGSITLTRDGSRQILVRGPLQFCGGTGNCPIWVFLRHHGKLRLILEAEGKSLLPGKGAYLGFSDLVVPFHESAFETSLTIYRWDGDKYRGVDCYITKSDPDLPDKPPAIQDCPRIPH